MRTVGTVVRGIRAPIFRKGDDLAKLTCECVLQAAQSEGFAIKDRDVIGVTESTLARTQGNYATVEQIAADVRSKFPGGVAGIVHPILSRNRFSLLLKGISMGLDKLYIQLAYPSDEVGNHLISWDELDEKGVNPTSDVLTEQKYRELFGYVKHPFTGVDYVEYYGDLFRAEGCEVEFLFANDVRAILPYTKNVLCCDIHSRQRSRRRLLNAGAEKVLLLSDLMTAPVDGSGYNEQFGLLGSNKATEDSVKLFPRDCKTFVDALADSLRRATGKQIEAMIYGDGAFKDPMGKIWELADPVVSPAYTDGLEGQPNELKLKYLADNDFASLSGEALTAAIKDSISHKDGDLKGQMSSQGTTPRRLTDLIGSLCDLTSGSGDKGTPIILIQGYFDNYAKDSK